MEVEIEQPEDEIYEDLDDEELFKDGEGNEIFPTHVIVLKSGEVFMAHESIELERMVGIEDSELITVVDALHYPEDGERSIITVVNDRIDYVQEWYHQEVWDELVTVAIESTIKGKTEVVGDKGMYL